MKSKIRPGRLGIICYRKIAEWKITVKDITSGEQKTVEVREFLSS